MNACLCIVGWYFRQDLLVTLKTIPGLQLYILSHKPRNTVPEWIWDHISEKDLLFDRNIGYDWGAYQQFLDKGVWSEFDTVFFMHDDINIVDPSVFQHCDKLLHASSKNFVIGNGRVTTKRDWPLTHIQSYAHSSWKPPSWDFKHDTVRGSFFALSKAALSQIGSFEILWDRRKLIGVGAGNYSLRATCGKIQFILGEDSFLFLSESYRHSSFIIELERGEPKIVQPRHSIKQKIATRILFLFSKTMMTFYMNGTHSQKQTLARWMQIVFRSF